MTTIACLICRSSLKLLEQNQICPAQSGALVVDGRGVIWHWDKAEPETAGATAKDATYESVRECQTYDKLQAA